MDKHKQQKAILFLLGVAAGIVVVASLEALTFAKSSELFAAFLAQNPQLNAQEYLSIVLLNFALTVSEAIIISLYTYFVYGKSTNKRLTKYIFGGLICLRFISILMKFALLSVFYYLQLLLHLLFFVTVITLPTVKGE